MNERDEIYLEIRRAVDNLVSKIKTGRLSALEKTIIARIFISAALEFLDESIDDVMRALDTVRRLRGGKA